MIGVHVRGTDAVSDRECRAFRIGSLRPDEYLSTIRRLLSEQPEARILVATDDEASLALLREGSGYQKGREVLVDCLLVARCDLLLRCTSHVSEAALWFNPDLPSLEMNYREATAPEGQ